MKHSGWSQSVRWLVASCAFVGGCTQVHEVDLSRIRGFQWNQRVRVQQTYGGFLQGWRVDYIELESDDGVKAKLEPDNGNLRTSVVLPVTTCPAPAAAQVAS
jgi:hypothetical protein